MGKCIDCGIELKENWKQRCTDCYGKNKDKHRQTNDETGHSYSGTGKSSDAKIPSDSERMYELVLEARRIVEKLWPELKDSEKRIFEKEIGTSLFIQDSQKRNRRL